jgi:hypothetical protein
MHSTELGQEVNPFSRAEPLLDEPSRFRDFVVLECVVDQTISITEAANQALDNDISREIGLLAERTNSLVGRRDAFVAKFFLANA